MGVQREASSQSNSTRFEIQLGYLAHMYNRTATSMLTILGLPLVTLGVYLLGVCWADNYLACPSTMSATIDSVNFLNVAGSN